MKSQNGWWTKERQQYAYDRLTTEAKLSDVGAKGLISRWANVEAPAGPTAKNSITGGHRGIAQWGQKRSKGLPANADFSVQLDHAISELNGKEKKAGDLLRDATTMEEGAIGASAYERAEGYSARTNRDNFTRTTLAGMPGIALSDAAVAAADPQQAPSGGLAAFFHDPLGMSAQAAEMPAGLAAYAAPEAKGLLGATGYDPAKNPMNARVDAMFANQVNPAPALSQPSFDARFAAQPSPAQFDARFGTPATAVAERFAPGLQAPAGPFSPTQYAEATQPSSAKARAAFDSIAAGLGAPSVSTQPDSLGAQVGAMVGPAPSAPDATQGRMSPDGQVADPFGNYKQAGPLGTVQKAETARMPGAALAYAPEAAPALGAPQDVAAASAPPQGLGAYSGQTASLSPDMMAPQQFAGLLPDMAPEMPQAAYDKLSRSLAPPADPQVAEVAGQTIADPMGAYPDAPTPGNTFPAAPPAPTRMEAQLASMKANPMSTLAKAGLGFLTGGPLGLAMGLGGNLGMAGLRDALGNGGPNAMGFRDVGSVANAMGGVAGDTGYSKSLPGYGWAKTATGGLRFGKYGIQPTDAQGTQTGGLMSYDGGGLGGFLGGLFGGSKHDKDKAGKGLGGINGSGYSGKGLY